MPSARHRALADANLLWQFCSICIAQHAPEVLRDHLERITRRFQLAARIDEDTIESMPADCGIYIFYGDDDAPLYVGKSVRLRQRVRSHLVGPRRSSKDLRLSALVRRVEWKATSGEIGALLAEAQMIADLRPPHNRAIKPQKGTMPWPYAGAIGIEKRDAEPARSSGMWSTNGVISARRYRSMKRARCALMPMPPLLPSLFIAFSASVWRTASVSRFSTRTRPQARFRFNPPRPRRPPRTHATALA